MSAVFCIFGLIKFIFLALVSCLGWILHFVDWLLLESFKITIKPPAVSLQSQQPPSLPTPPSKNKKKEKKKEPNNTNLKSCLTNHWRIKVLSSAPKSRISGFGVGELLERMITMHGEWLLCAWSFFFHTLLEWSLALNLVLIFYVFLSLIFWIIVPWNLDSIFPIVY